MPTTGTTKRHRCTSHRVLANKLETLVWDRLRNFLSEPGVIVKVLESVRKLNAANPNRVERTRLKASIAAFESQLESLAERIAELPKGISAAPLYKQLDKIQSGKGDAETRLLSLGLEGHQAPSRIVDDITMENFRVRYAKLLRDELTETQKRQIVRKFIHKVEVGVDSVKIEFLVEPQTWVQIEPIAWREPNFDLAELARLRWVEKWSRKELAKHFGKTEIAIQQHFHKLKVKKFQVAGIAQLEKRRYLRLTRIPWG